jgi:hypothetical protein
VPGGAILLSLHPSNPLFEQEEYLPGSDHDRGVGSDHDRGVGPGLLHPRGSLPRARGPRHPLRRR